MLILKSPFSKIIKFKYPKKLDFSMETEEKCRKCNGTGRVREKNGIYHICYDCLAEGRLNQHSKVKDSKIRL